MMILLLQRSFMFIMMGISFILVPQSQTIVIALDASTMTTNDHTKDDDHILFVQEVLVENQQDEEPYHDDTTTHHISEEEKEEERHQQKVASEQERNKKHQERIQKERMDAYYQKEQELKENKQALQTLQKQQRHDHKIVQYIIYAYEQHQYYSVLGLQIPFLLQTICHYIQYTIIPNIPIIRQVPNIIHRIYPKNSNNNDGNHHQCYYTISSQQIKRAYRERSKLVHPDKNLDHRTVDAFYMIEEVTTNILLHPQKKVLYDQQIMKQQQEQIQQWIHTIQSYVHYTIRIVHRTILTTKTILGPFTIPVVIFILMIV